jgi:hypothetical protein
MLLLDYATKIIIKINAARYMLPLDRLVFKMLPLDGILVFKMLPLVFKMLPLEFFESSVTVVCSMFEVGQ